MWLTILILSVSVDLAKDHCSANADCCDAEENTCCHAHNSEILVISCIIVFDFQKLWVVEDVSDDLFVERADEVSSH